MFADFLGRTEVRIKDILQEKQATEGPITKHLPLHEVDSGQVVVKLDLQLFDGHWYGMDWRSLGYFVYIMIAGWSTVVACCHNAASDGILVTVQTGFTLIFWDLLMQWLDFLCVFQTQCAEKMNIQAMD